MKSIAFAALSFTALIGVPAGSAQPLADSLFATVPFDFHAGRTVLPAGRYEVKRTVSNMIILHRPDGLASAFVVAAGRSRPESGELGGVLRFEHYRDQYLLTEVFAPDAASGLGIHAPKVWKEMKESVAAGDAPRTIEIAAFRGSAR